MCTLILGLDRPASGWLTLAANRDEALERPSDPPLVLATEPRVLGGRDRISGGTWFAIRRTPPLRVAAVLNRREHGGAPVETGESLSRGVICLDAARAPSFEAAEHHIAEQVTEHAVAPFSLVLIEEHRARVAYFENQQLRWSDLSAGYHVLTHGDADDPRDARVAHGLETTAVLDAGQPDEPAPLLDALAVFLSRHDGEPAVCLHGDGFGTVSSTLLALDFSSSAALWRFWPGPPCRSSYTDVTALLSGMGSPSAAWRPES